MRQKKVLNGMLDFLFGQRDPYTIAHCKSVSWIACELLNHYKEEEDFCESLLHFRQEMEIAGYLHDIGKFHWSDHILQGREKVEKDEITDHPENAVQFLSYVYPSLESKHKLSISLIGAHHWKYVIDDDDYPHPTRSAIASNIYNIVRQNKMPDKTWDLLRCTLQGADCFHARLSNRLYRGDGKIMMTPEEVIVEMKDKNEAHGHSLYHPKVLEALEAKVDCLSALCNESNSHHC